MFVGKIFELLLTYLLLLATNDSINILIIQYILNILWVAINSAECSLILFII